MNVLQVAVNMARWSNLAYEEDIEARANSHAGDASCPFPMRYPLKSLIIGMNCPLECLDFPGLFGLVEWCVMHTLT